MSHSAVQGQPGNVPASAETSEADFSTFRSFVPLVADNKVTYLNASNQPPSNLIVYNAINKYASKALFDPHRKPSWQHAVEETRELVGRYINADTSSIAFARDTTEALGCFIRGLKFESGDNVVILDSEHPNHAYGWMTLRTAGLDVRQIPTIPESERTGRVTVANASTFLPPHGIHVLADLTQQVGFAEVDVKSLGVSAAAFSLHKGLNCPVGFAVLYVDPAVIMETNPTPPIVGYGAVSNGRADLLVPDEPLIYHPTTRRYEHLNLNLIAATSAKAFLNFYLNSMGPKRVQEHLYRLGDVLREECDSLGVKIMGPVSRTEHAPHLYILDLYDPRWMDLLKENQILVTIYRLGIRVSFGFYNNLEDVKKLVVVLKSGIESGLPI